MPMPTPDATRPPSAPIRMALVGLGAMADNVLTCLPRLTGVTLAAVVEPREQRRQSIATRFQAAAFSDYTDMLAAMGDGLDLIYIASPNAAHEQQAIAAIERGLPLVLQKPMAADLDGCRAIMRAWRCKPAFLYVGFELRLSRMFRRVKELIDEGYVGRVRDVSVNYYTGLWPDWFEKGHAWKYQRGGSGGMFAEKLCHSLDLMRHWSGDEFRQVTAYGPAEPVIPYFQIADNLHAIFRMAGGGCGRISFSFTRAAAMAFDPGPANYDPDEKQGHAYDFTVIGDRGSIWLNVDRKFLSLVTHRVDRGQFTPSLERVEDFTPFASNKDLYHDNESELQQVIDRLARLQPPPILPEDAYRSMVAVYKAQQSLDEGRTIRFDDDPTEAAADRLCATTEMETV